MGKILLFEEISDKVMKQIKNQHEKIDSKLIKPEDYIYPSLIGIKNYQVPNEKTPYDLIFHYILKKNKDKFEPIKPGIEKGFVASFIPVYYRGTDLSYLMTYMVAVRSKNPSANTFFIRDTRKKIREKKLTNGTEVMTYVSPTPTFYRWKKKRQGGKEVLEIPNYLVLTQEKFVTEYYPEDSEKQKQFFDSLRAKIDKAHPNPTLRPNPLPQNPRLIIIPVPNIIKSGYNH